MGGGVRIGAHRAVGLPGGRRNVETRAERAEAPATDWSVMFPACFSGVCLIALVACHTVHPATCASTSARWLSWPRTASPEAVRRRRIAQLMNRSASAAVSIEPGLSRHGSFRGRRRSWRTRRHARADPPWSRGPGTLVPSSGTLARACEKPSGSWIARGNGPNGHPRWRTLPDNPLFLATRFTICGRRSGDARIPVAIRNHSRTLCGGGIGGCELAS
jgi:hypothetical protein